MGNPKNRSRAIKRKKVVCVGNKKAEASPANLRIVKKSRKESLWMNLQIKETLLSVDPENYNFIMNFAVLKAFVCPLLSCPECNSRNVELSDELSLRMGYAHKLRLNCHDCPYNVDSFTSPECGKSESIQGRRKFEINVRAVVAFREVGKGHESMINISRCLNMYVITETTYAALDQSLYHQAYQEAADNSMQLAVREIKTATNDNNSQPTKCRVSFDGTWQKRGFSSSNGIVTAMNSGKCIDVHVMSKNCKKCAVWHERQNDPEYDYDQWKAEHFDSGECEINHSKSSGAMEAAGAVVLFSRSVKKNSLIAI